MKAQQQHRQRRSRDAAVARAQHRGAQVAAGVADAEQIAADHAGAGQHHQPGRDAGTAERGIVTVAEADGGRDRVDRVRPCPSDNATPAAVGTGLAARSAAFAAAASRGVSAGSMDSATSVVVAPGRKPAVAQRVEQIGAHHAAQ